MKEIELIDNFCNYLEQNQKKLEYKRELRRGSYHNEGYIDIVIRNEFNEFSAIEAKINSYSAVLTQATSNYFFFHYSYILYPRTPIKKLLQKTRKYGIGLIIPVDGVFQVLIKPRSSIFRKYKISSRYFFERSKKYRNWNENRIGRKFSEKELPINYPKKRLKKILPKYEW